MQLQYKIQRSMLNQNPKPYFNQVAMIESQYESKRRNLTSSNNSSLLQNKSPLRERENTNSINTPSRMQTNMQTGAKVSLSPIRLRRNQQAMASVRTTASTAVSRKKATENYCENHTNKLAKFMIDKDNEQFFFCDRCAIPLISNGFKLLKIGDDEEKEMENPRLKQINQFLKQLESMESGLNKKKQTINSTITQGKKQLDTELQKIQDFYAQFYQIIDEHKRRVVEEMKIEYEKSSRNVNGSKQRVEEAIKDSMNMKQDILSSMNSVILEVMDHEFRSVMNQYYGNLENFREICNLKVDQPIKVRTLSFRDAETVCQNLIQGLVIEWNDQQEGEQIAEVTKNETNMFEYQSRARTREEQESDRQNPIECLQTQQRKTNNTKQLGGLFCSFDE